jgi:hypothetical protein
LGAALTASFGVAGDCAANGVEVIATAAAASADTRMRERIPMDILVIIFSFHQSWFETGWRCKSINNNNNTATVG